MSDEPFFRQLDDVEALIEEANEQSDEQPIDPPVPPVSRKARARVVLDLPPNVRTVRAMRNRRRVIE